MHNIDTKGVFIFIVLFCCFSLSLSLSLFRSVFLSFFIAFSLSFFFLSFFLSFFLYLLFFSLSLSLSLFVSPRCGGLRPEALSGSDFHIHLLQYAGRLAVHLRPIPLPLLCQDALVLSCALVSVPPDAGPPFFNVPPPFQPFFPLREAAGSRREEGHAAPKSHAGGMQRTLCALHLTEVGAQSQRSSGGAA